jgi:hypothetical protein
MRALKNIDLGKVLFISIECVPQENELPVQGLTYNSWTDGGNEAESYAETAPLFPEYGRIFCVSLGYVNNHQLNIKTIQGEENELIETLFKMVNAFQNSWGTVHLCGHSVKSFILPYVMRRAIVNDIPVQYLFDASGLKPWDITWMYDIKELWQGTAYKSASLLSLAHTFNLDYAESIILGKDVTTMYLNDEIEEITHRCEVNVRLCHDVLKKMAGIKTDWKDEILAQAQSGGALEKAYKGIVSVKDIEDLKSKLSSMELDKKATKVILETMFKGNVPNELNGLF